MDKSTAARIEYILKNNSEYARKVDILNRDSAERLSLLRLDFRASIDICIDNIGSVSAYCI
jgi:hypothetical protein